MRAAPLLALLLLPLPAAAVEVDFSDLYGGPRDQCDTGSCHAFASVALLEAALRRRARDAEPVRLSDADLFLQTTVINGGGPYTPGGFREGEEDRVIVARREPPPRRRVLMERKLVEGGYPSADLRFALEHGVALQETVPWGPFLRRFDRFRERRRAAFREAAGRPDDEEALLSYEESLIPSRERRREEEAFLYEDPAAAARDRERVKGLLAGFSVHASTFVSVVPSAEDEDKCAAWGQPVRRRLLEDFDLRRPMVVCLRLDGLAEWGKEAARHSAHCVAIAGFKKPRGGPLTLYTRNSWGRSTHPEIPEEQFCRIHEVVSLRP